MAVTAGCDEGGQVSPRASRPDPKPWCWEPVGPSAQGWQVFLNGFKLSGFPTRLGILGLGPGYGSLGYLW